MSKFFLAAGAAALAFAAPAMAGQPDRGGQGKGNGQQQAKDHNGDRGGGQKADRGAAKVKMQAKAHERGKHGQGQMVERGINNSRNAQRLEKAAKQTKAVTNLNNGRGSTDRVRAFDHRVRTTFIPAWDNRGSISGFAQGCPPGLAKKGNGCLPPGQAKKIVGTALPAALSGAVLAGPFSQWYRDDDRYFYRWDDDHVYRVRRNGGLIDALFPTIDRDYYYYPVGYEYPSAYNYYNVPYQYQSFYPEQGNWTYRYGDGAIYRVDPSTSMISGIASLLAGDLAVGQPLPTDYMVYNVPMSYRDRYYDSADNWYRYNDGYIYRVDPTTQLITAVINAIV